jgi:D-aminopeptidase
VENRRTRGVRLEDEVWMERPQENQRTRLVPLTGADSPDVAGRYRCAELDLPDARSARYGALPGRSARGGWNW